MKYKPARDIPRFARQHNTLSPTELTKIILMRRNKQVTSQSVSKWFQRNPTVLAELKAEILQEELPALEASPSIFRNGTFEEISAVKTWIEEMHSRDIVNWKSNVAAVKRCCMGRFPRLKVDLVKEGLMCLKHPDRYTTKDAQDLVKEMKKKGLETSSFRLPLRNFLMSKGEKVQFKISGAKSKGFGQFADLFVSKPILNSMLEYIKELNYEVYATTLFMFKTGTRINATLEARIETIKTETEHGIEKKMVIDTMQGRKEFSYNEEFTMILTALRHKVNIEKRKTTSIYREITVYDKARRSKHAKGKPWKKHIDEQLFNALLPLIQNREKGLIFEHATEQDCAKLNRAAMKVFIAGLNDKIPMPNHFWRHMFFQHMLRATDWNYKVAAALGGSTAASVEESYGQPPRAVKRKWGLKYIPTI